jgi:LPS sulfotransferase NodH
MTKKADLRGVVSARAEAANDELHEVYLEAVERPVARLSRFSEVAFKSNPFRHLKKRFVLATSGSRVGSHLLIENLYTHGVDIDEYFNVNRIKKAVERRNLSSVEDYCEFVLKRFAKNDVFGVKGGTITLGPLSLAKEFPDHAQEWAFVYLLRQDIVRQAVSLVKAQLTGAWNSTIEPSAPIAEDQYDAGEIRGKIDHILLQEYRWRCIFELFDITPLRLTYEALTDDPSGAAARAAAFAGLEGPPIVKDEPAFEAQADEINDRWSERFRTENPALCRELDARSPQ